jgi:hypothetical protein
MAEPTKKENKSVLGSLFGAVDPRPMAKSVYNSTFHPDMNDRGGNAISDMARNLYHAHKDTSDKAEEAAGKAMNSHNFKDWAGNESKSLGYSLATMVPGVGPVAAHAAERLGGDPDRGIAPDVKGGLAEGAGLIGGTLLGGVKMRGANRLMEAAAPAAEAEKGLQMAIPGKVLQMPSPVAEVAAPGRLESAMYRGAAKAQDWVTNRGLQKLGAARPEVTGGEMELLQGGRTPPVANPEAMAYRSRSIGDEGVSRGARPKLTMDEAQARSYMPGRADVTGRAQQLVKVPLDEMPGFSVAPKGSGQKWVTLHGDVPEASVKPILGSMEADKLAK